MNQFTFSAVWKGLMGLFIFTLAGLSSLAKAFALISSVAEQTAGEYSDDATHARAVRHKERQALLATDPVDPLI